MTPSLLEHHTAKNIHRPRPVCGYFRGCAVSLRRQEEDEVEQEDRRGQDA